jgi:hypothetical protein
MKQGRKETMMTRIISTTFVVVALAVFKPFGLDAWQWQAYVHLVALGVIGVFICMTTDIILKYIVKMPRSFKKGVEYIIRRNLWFQLINTPLVALGICLYRHFVLSDRVESNRLSVVNFLETLVIIAFCSFAIGLYWRFKFRSRYLAAELEETRLLNEQLQAKKEPEESLSDTIVLTGTTSETITLHIPSLLYIEAVGNYVKVYQWRDDALHTDMLRATMKQVEDDLQGYPAVVRCHRAFMVNLQQVEKVLAKSGIMRLVIRHTHDALPVSRSNMAGVKEAIKGV